MSAGVVSPHDIDERWRRWRLDDLLILPGRWPLVVLEPTRHPFEIVRAVVNAPDVEYVATGRGSLSTFEALARLRT